MNANTNLLKDDKAESPIEVLITIMVGIIIMTGVMFSEGIWLDGFLHLIQLFPITLQPTFQHMFSSLIDLGAIFFAIPSFFVAVLIVWGFKALFRKVGYTRTGQEVYYEEY